ncbi:MAG TPA: hypothetical protein VL358_03905 [Caulobacteraceae bacterium]|jgi:hypothetical protein|nr:hypothetical protein [Caulobacteraceae bacterium]
MFKLAAICSGVFGLAVTLQGGEALAQSTSTCMAMGPNMVHCDTMNMGPSPESAPRPHPSDVQPDYEGQRRLGEAMHKLIFGDKEKAFRTKIGKMLAGGDCQGAARVALQDGRLELGQSIMATCRTNSTPIPNTSPITQLAPSKATSGQTATPAPVTSYALPPQAAASAVAPVQSTSPASPSSADPYERTTRIWIGGRLVQ